MTGQLLCFLSSQRRDSEVPPPQSICFSTAQQESVKSVHLLNGQVLFYCRILLPWTTKRGRYTTPALAHIRMHAHAHAHASRGAHCGAGVTLRQLSFFQNVCLESNKEIPLFPLFSKTFSSLCPGGWSLMHICWGRIIFAWSKAGGGLSSVFFSSSSNR